MSYLGEVRLEDNFGPFLVFREKCGYVPNLLHAQSVLPRLIEAQACLESDLRLNDGAISKLQKSRIFLSIAAARDDTYCATTESNALASLGVSDNQIKSLLNDYRRADLSPTDVALMDFCLRLACHAPSMDSEDVEDLRANGFSDEAIIEAVLATGLAVYRCTLSVGLGPKPDFEPGKLPSKMIILPREAHHHGGHEAAHKRGPYVRVPYLNPNTFAPFAVLYQSHQFVPNFFRAQTLRPDLLAAQTEAVAKLLLPEDVLTRLQKECILLAVSAANLNSYCVAIHCNLLRGLGIPAEEGDQIAVDHHQSLLSNADKALLDFAIKLGTHFSEFSAEDIAQLRAIGFTAEQILECEAVTALNNFANIVQMGLGFEPDFEPPPGYEQNKMYLSAAVSPPISVGSPAESTIRLTADPDADLVAKAKAGDLEAFELLVRRHTQLIYRALLAILGNSSDAQDAMQDALLSAFKHISGFQGRSKFSTWLVSIARNAALQRLRTRKSQESLDERALDDDDSNFRPRQVRVWVDNPEQAYSRSEIRRLVETGISGLPTKYRTVVMLRDIEQFSTDEVARQLGLTVPAVKVRLLRGRLMLREWLSPHFTTQSRGARQ